MKNEDHKIDDECKWSNDCISISNGDYGVSSQYKIDNLHEDKDGLLSNYDETIKCRCIKLSDKEIQEYLEGLKKQIRDHNSCI